MMRLFSSQEQCSYAFTKLQEANLSLSERDLVILIKNFKRFTSGGRTLETRKTDLSLLYTIWKVEADALPWDDIEEHYHLVVKKLIG